MTDVRLDVLAEPGAVPDPAEEPAAEREVSAALQARGLAGGLVLARSAEEFAAALAKAAPRGEVVLLPAGAGPLAGRPELADLPGVLRVDLPEREPDTSPGVRAHIWGRGVVGLRYAVDCWFHRRFHPATPVGYGEHPEQRGELRLPAGTGPFPVAVLIHGGYWRSRWALDLMDALAVDLTGRGFATWNIEYRRPDRHGWPATTADVAAACAALAGLPGADRLDLDRVALIGHSAGGQLALRWAADAVADPAAPIRPALAVSLAGVLDLRAAEQRGLGRGAVRAALGGPPTADPGRYRCSSPWERLPLGLPQLVACGRADDPELLEISRRYAAAAAEVRYLEADGDHFDIITPGRALWAGVADELAA